MKKKQLVIVADDMGYHPNITHGIIKCFMMHAITSASIITKTQEWDAIKQFVRSHPDADFGIHLTVPQEKKSLQQLTKSFMQQLDIYTHIMEKKPTNFSLHHDAIVRTYAKSKTDTAIILLGLKQFEEKTNIPNRSRFFDHTYTLSHGSDHTQTLEHIAETLPEGTNLLITHPAYIQGGQMSPLRSLYTLQQRYMDYAALTSPKTEYIVKYSNINCINFYEIDRQRRLYETKKK